MLSLYGTLTSPFVRRVRVVADELGVPTTLVDINDPANVSEFRALSPIWKAPVAVLRGVTILDSHTITETLMATDGPGPLLPFDPLDVGARNAIAIADGALDALINGFYLAKDGIALEQSGYLRKQQERAAAAMRALDAIVASSDVADAIVASSDVADAIVASSDFGPKLGLVEIALFTSLDWMRFRNTYPIDQHPNLVAFMSRHAARPSFVRTRPVDAPT